VSIVVELNAVPPVAALYQLIVAPVMGVATKSLTLEPVHNVWVLLPVGAAKAVPLAEPVRLIVKPPEQVCACACTTEPIKVTTSKKEKIFFNMSYFFLMDEILLNDYCATQPFTSVMMNLYVALPCKPENVLEPPLVVIVAELPTMVTFCPTIGLGEMVVPQAAIE
jgi:hypothetical protein